MSDGSAAIEVSVDDDDLSLDAHSAVEGIPLTFCVSSDAGQELALSLQASPHLALSLTAHNKEDLSPYDSASVVVFEIRMSEAFDDLLIIRSLRAHRPLVPIIAVSANDDPDFTAEAFRAGVNDYVLPSVGAEVLTFRVQSLHKLSESARLIEVQNAELVRTMRAQRKADEEKHIAERQRSEAQAQADANRRTREILDNLQEGFFVVDADLKISEVVSKSCATIFERSIAGETLLKALGLKGRTEEFMQTALMQVFDDFLPRQVSLAMVPSLCETESGKTLSFAYTAVPEDGPPARVIVVAKDMTREVKARQALEARNSLNQALISILRDKSSFMDFFADVKKDLSELAATGDEQLTKRILHTLKGNTASYGLNVIAKAIHELETALQEVPLADYAAWNQEAVAAIDHLFSDFLSEHAEVLQIAPGHEGGTVSVSVEQLRQIAELGQELPAALRERLAALLREAQMRQVGSYLRPFDTAIQRIAERQDKKVQYLVKGGEVRVDGATFGPFFKSLIHAVRNACDHGIEIPDERSHHGKREQGTIHIRVSQIPGQLQVTVTDDGRGIQSERLIERAVSKGLLSQAAAEGMDPRQAFRIIFLDGLSTSEDVSDISGRGVGMSCIKEEVTRLAGKLEIASEKNVGTRITMTLPLTRTPS